MSEGVRSAKSGKIEIDETTTMTVSGGKIKIVDEIKTTITRTVSGGAKRRSTAMTTTTTAIGGERRDERRTGETEVGVETTTIGETKGKSEIVDIGAGLQTATRGKKSVVSAIAEMGVEVGIRRIDGSGGETTTTMIAMSGNGGIRTTSTTRSSRWASYLEAWAYISPASVFG